MLVALVMLLTSLIPSFTVNAAFSDVTDTNPYNEAITTLSTLSVINGYDDGSFGPDKEISRAEFTAIIVRMLGMDNLTTPITTFPDVATDHWANYNIKTAYDLGIINGYDDGTFRPDSPVTYEQALKMIVCTLGYQPYAEAAGGYPGGYTTQASSLKLMDKISDITFTQNAPRGVIAQAMFNALEVPIHGQVGSSWSNTGKTLMKDYLNIIYTKGVLVGVGDSTTADCTTSLYTNQLAVKDSSSGDIHVINIGSYEITVAELVAKLGTTVQVYFRQPKGSNDKTLFEFIDDAQISSELTINSTDITEYDGNTITYRKSGQSSTSTARINTTSASIRYNGKVVDPDDITLSNYLNPTSPDFIYGTVRLVSSTTSGSFDTVDIYDYDVYVAQKAVTTEKYELVDKLVTANTEELDPNSYYTLSVTRNGSEVAPTSIATNDVVLYAESFDGTYKTVKASSNTVSGKITTINDAKGTVTINGNEYRYSDYFTKYIEKYQSGKSLSLGASLTGYVDDFGTIHWGTITISETTTPYAYVIDARDESEDAWVQLFAPTSTSTSQVTASTAYKVKKFRLADKVKVNGNRISDSAAIAELKNLKPKAPDGATLNDYNQFIKVGFNSSGFVDTIITVTGTGSINTEPAELVQYNCGKFDLSSNSITDNGKTLYSFSSSTPLFMIPKDRTQTSKYAVKAVISSTSLKSSDKDKLLDAYDVSSSQYPGMIAYYVDNAESVVTGTPVTANTKYSLISLDGAEFEMDDDLGEVHIIDVYEESTTPTKKKLTDKLYKQISDGDIVQFSYDAEGNIDKIESRIPYSEVIAELKNESYDLTSWNGNTSVSNSTLKRYHGVYNVLRNIDGTQLHVSQDVVTTDDATDSYSYESITISSNTPVLTWNKNGDLEVASIDDIQLALDFNDGCSKVAILSTKTDGSAKTAKLIVIYK